MKKPLFIVTFLFLSLISMAQNIDDIGKIALSVVMPTNTDKLKPSEFAKLESKIQQLTAKHGISGSDYNTNFVIAPKFEIYEDEVLNAGLSVKTLVKGELSLYVSQASNSLIFNTVSLIIKGVGENRDKAILNAISNIDVNNKDLNTFFVEAKEKIIQYYMSNCEQISNKADALIKKHDYQGAIGLLMTVPEEVSCYDNIQQKTIEAYKAYQNQKCSMQIQEAKTTLAKNYYRDALDILSQIDPSANCYKEAETLIKKAEDKVDAQARNQFAIRMKIYNDNIALENQRIQAAKEIAIEYYRNQPKPATNNYLLLVK